MNIEERKTFRLKLLKELYNHHFKSNGTQKQLDKRDLAKEIEKQLAYEYLAEKGLITIKQSAGAQFSCKVTALGIDLIESQWEVI
ncbi:hypothetical protein Desde_1074 [Desulfitobacterium dehalogenans ATCC 51507]|uniref:Uncharacterized protein n=1 Tax=Desulfitobacterium dehalogenans (strain ATCC 51507 / DSM 9161 / JW/IU-DC1) TaxID=756499 RepID=I4A6C2_DESDJ|nr:hypothetical protein [Desulfitobacterium dehalogenans]AFL99506.1 hypothetical protein Desde_1074 [Desulfitobacterium dehalogenans ATCC 51507]